MLFFDYLLKLLRDKLQQSNRALLRDVLADHRQCNPETFESIDFAAWELQMEDESHGRGIS